jgi:hypothetical protein
MVNAPRPSPDRGTLNFPVKPIQIEACSGRLRGQESVGIDRTVESPWSIDKIAAECCDKGHCPPIAMGSITHQPLDGWLSTVSTAMIMHHGITALQLA